MFGIGLLMESIRTTIVRPGEWPTRVAPHNPHRVHHAFVTADLPALGPFHPNYFDNAGQQAHITHAGGTRRRDNPNGVTQMSESTNGNGTYLDFTTPGSDVQVRIYAEEIPEEMMWEGFKRAFRHVLSNEVASKVGGDAEKLVKAGTHTVEDTKAGSPWYVARQIEYRLDFINAVKAGTWGTGRGGPTGPRVDPFEAEYAREVARATKNYLQADKRISYDKESKVWFFDVAGPPDENGTPTRVRHTRTLEQAIDGYVAKQLTEEKKAEMEASARATVEAKRRKAEQAKADAAATPVTEEVLI